MWRRSTKSTIPEEDLGLNDADVVIFKYYCFHDIDKTGHFDKRFIEKTINIWSQKRLAAMLYKTGLLILH